MLTDVLKFFSPSDSAEIV